MKWLCALVLSFATPCFAASEGRSMRQFSNQEPVAIQYDAAYVLFRTDPRATQRFKLARFAFDFIFVPADVLSGNVGSNNDRATNVFRPFVSKPYDTSADAQFVLVSLPPGNYV